MVEYEKHYSDSSFQGKIKKYGKKAGMKAVYSGLVLYYSLQNEKMPIKSRLAIIAALGYFIFAMDAVPDILIGMGYTDDITVLMGTLMLVSKYVDEEAKQKARNRVISLFGIKDTEAMDNVDKGLRLGDKSQAMP
ncbi:hypothetical protein CUJ83_12665 [Methanocella sp. CWC-04]|uniref:DUF1232 domain-containing protein n=1 Tax=Methanooceanicella nereidis TaxID=2052831 RepID=A0AAP2REF9_9EURY|nr:YkvA family protein [Methanocella sp. CWC-04]MCD1295848.1 hypothetical protein [Methanocella sp. CWC-04]